MNSELTKKCIVTAVRKIIEESDGLPRQSEFVMPGYPYYQGVVSLVSNTYRNCVDFNAGVESDEIVCYLNVEHFESLEEAIENLEDDRIIHRAYCNMITAKKKLDVDY